MTKELGPRLEAEVLQARERTIQNERWTEIDRSIQRKADGSGVVSYEGFEPHSDGARVRAEQEVARLRFLEGIGLARQTGEGSWQLSADHERELRARQISKDIVKTRSQNRKREHDHGLDRGFERRRDFNG